MEYIYIWAGNDLYATLPYRLMSEVKLYGNCRLLCYLPNVLEDFGDGVDLKKVNDNKYEIDVSFVRPFMSKY